VSQSSVDQGAETRTQETRTFIRQVRAASCRKYTPEEKIRIVLEGLHREVIVSGLCRREGIKPGTFYAWTKDPSASSGQDSWKRARSASPGTPSEMLPARRSSPSRGEP
jgi:transposase-like protein